MSRNGTSSTRVARPRGRATRAASIIVGALAIVALLVAAGSLALFQSSQTRSTSITSGTVSITLSEPGTASLNDSLSDFLPGDFRDRAVNVNNTSSNSANNGALTLSASATPTNALSTDMTDGLQVTVWSCSVAYTEAGAAPYTYTCSGTETAVQAATAFSNISNITLSSAFTATNGYYKLRVAMPSTAGNAFQGLSTTATWTFTLSQRTGQQI